MRRTARARWSCLAKVVERMRSGGWFRPQDLASQLNLPERTIDHDLKLGTHIGILKHDEERGQYAWIDYESGEERVRRLVGIWGSLALTSIIAHERFEPIEEFERMVIPLAAAESGNDPQDKDFRKLAFRVLGEFFKEPERFVAPELLKAAGEVASKRLKQYLSELKDEILKERDRIHTEAPENM